MPLLVSPSAPLTTSSSVGFGIDQLTQSGRDVAQILLPEFFVVGKHEVFRDAGAECLQHPVVEVVRRRPSVRACMLSTKPITHSLTTSGGKSVGVGLKRIGRRVRISNRSTRSRSWELKRVRQDFRDQFLGVLVSQMNQVAGAVEGEAVLREGSAEAADFLSRVQRQSVRAPPDDSRR